MTSSTVSAQTSASEASLRPTTTGRRFAAWLVDLVIVAALVGVVYLSGLIRIQGCDTFDPDTGTFGASCPFEQTREVEREDGSIEVVYVLGSGRELPVDHPTVKTVVLGTRVVDPPGAATYLVGLGYVLAVFVLLQGLTGRTPGKLVSGIRLVRDDGRAPGASPAFLRWLVVDGAIGLFGVLMGLVGGPWPLRLLALDAAVGLLGGAAALTGQGRPGDQLARTVVVDDAEAARARRRTPRDGDTGSSAPTIAGAAASVSVAEDTPAAASTPASAPPAEAEDEASAARQGDASRSGRPIPPPDRSEPSAPIPLGPAGTTGHGGEAPKPGQDEPGAETTSDPTGEIGAVPVSSSIPAPPEPGTRPRWGSSSLGAREAAGEQGPFVAPEYEATPPLWDQPSPTAPAGDTPAAGPTDESAPPTAATPTGTEAEDRTATTPTGESTDTDSEPPAGTDRPSEDPLDESTPADAVPATGEPADTGATAETEADPTARPETGDDRTGPETDEPGDDDATQPAELPATGEAAGDERDGEREDRPPDSSAAEAEDRDPVAPAAAAGQQQPLWDEERRAYIFWDNLRQEWLEFDYDNQRWGPISRA